jgi:hypothetical protein
MVQIFPLTNKKIENLLEIGRIFPVGKPKFSDIVN